MPMPRCASSFSPAPGVVCAGQDQRESAAMDAHGAARRIEGYASLYRAMRQVAKPLIARIQGYAAGAGLQSRVDVRPEDRRSGGETRHDGAQRRLGRDHGQRLPRSGHRRIGDATPVLLSEFIDAKQGLDIGLVHELMADDAALDARIAQIADGLASRPPLGIALSKEWWRVMGDAQFEAAMDHARGAHAKNYAAGGLSNAAQKFIAGARS